MARSVLFDGALASLNCSHDLLIGPALLALQISASDAQWQGIPVRAKNDPILEVFQPRVPVPGVDFIEVWDQVIPRPRCRAVNADVHLNEIMCLPERRGILQDRYRVTTNVAIHRESNYQHNHREHHRGASDDPAGAGGGHVRNGSWVAVSAVSDQRYSTRPC